MKAMSKARYYVYWNLHRDCYSVKHRGKVVGHHTNIIAYNVEFRVSQKGRKRVLKDQRKNVHAYVVAERLEIRTPSFEGIWNRPIKYNPYKYCSFVDNNEKAVYNADVVWLGMEGCKSKLRGQCDGVFC